MEEKAKLDRIFIWSNRQEVTFVLMKNTFPFHLTYCKFVEALFQMFGIDSGLCSQICNEWCCVKIVVRWSLYQLLS